MPRFAAFCVGDLDAAESYLNAATKKGVKIECGKGDSLDAVVRHFLQDPRPYKAAWKKEQAIRAAEAKADDLPRVLLKTNRGDVVIDLFEDQAPKTVENFVGLAGGTKEYIDPETGQPTTGNYYDDTKRYIEASTILSADDKHQIYEANTRRVFSRLDTRLKTKGL